MASGGRVFAIANRCPHEGYPLSEGSIGPDCVLTCNWHNWKFDLKTGAALVGRDPVRSYPVEIRGGEIFIDLTDPPAEAQRDRALKGLADAVGDNDRPRMAREVARLERAGFDARLALSHAIAARNAHLEYGTTHAHGAAADWLALAARATREDEQLAATLEPIAHLAWDTLGASRYPYAEDARDWNAEAFVAAVEAENEAEAVALMRGALWLGVAKRDIRAALGRAALAHYADFGHSAIYVRKTAELIDLLGPESETPILLALVRALVSATREERLPEFRGYARALAEWDGKGDAPARADAFVGLSVEAVLRRTLASSGRPAREIYDALLGAAAWNLLQFRYGDRPRDGQCHRRQCELARLHPCAHLRQRRALHLRRRAVAVAQGAVAARALRRAQQGLCEGAAGCRRLARRRHTALRRGRDGGALRSRHRRADHRLPPREDAVRVRGRIGRRAGCALGGCDGGRDEPLAAHAAEAASRPALAAQARDFVAKEG
ncbi:MAG: Rieske 2Fe-2S domain-containing protein [Rhizomicrobium sp.]